MSTIIRWGILGTGTVATQFIEGLQSISDAQLWAIGSRTLDKAQKFANIFNAPKAYGSYEELVQDPDIDVVYIATPQTRHKADSMLCLNAGKAVLCEKPFTVTSQEAREVMAVARQQKLFCMEAMWMRFMPLIQEVRRLIRAGEIGEVRLLTADFGYPTEFDPKNRFFNLELGGGALLDRGVYPLSLAFMLLGKPQQISGEPCIGKTGVDDQSAMILRYANGAMAILHSTLHTYSSNEALIVGTQGKIAIKEPFYKPESITITRFSGKPVVVTSQQKTIEVGWKRSIINQLKQNQLIKTLAKFRKEKSKSIGQRLSGNGYNYEATEVVKCLQAGKLESDLMPLSETIEIMETIESLLLQWHQKP
ncbi:Gfo/Idh/MocA family oxidoreductase [Leptolyngbya cf. ectocarpi LEGE 11479]|uniref:Gfo/Idh/MocA family oxidoreductase n=1 Tax=Leptolyngbya cf. ectocarpi LEGE 11479 TaxID=1828722 RepID=A0A928ZY84_LEPEC|nr:Gfo/Idh/MocA family oxidoreductase [Leptolyngbya ectocarpi]MBE9069694.1 Gfo/Idh/MocA family oxidoreductase [Leptolyngbya cf. ectocarpi LEGE 11479]